MTLRVFDKSLGFDKDSECTLYTLHDDKYKVCINVIIVHNTSSLTNSVASTANVTLRAMTSIVVNTSSLTFVIMQCIQSALRILVKTKGFVEYSQGHTCVHAWIHWGFL